MDQMRSEQSQPVHLTIEVQREEGDGGEPIREVFHAAGQVNQKGERLYITYTERSDEGPIRNILKLTGPCLTVIRHGAVKMNHLFQLGHSTRSTYYTNLGSFSMETYTSSLKFSCSPAFQTMLAGGQERLQGGLKRSDNGGEATLLWAYRLTLAGQPVGHIQFKISLLQPGGEKER